MTADPVCGMPVADGAGVVFDLDGRRFTFCSEFCRQQSWVRVMQQAIAINASFFNTHRMVRQYVDHAYAIENGDARAD